MPAKMAIAENINKASAQTERLFAQSQNRFDRYGPNPADAAQGKTAADIEPLLNEAKGILDGSNEAVRSVDLDGNITGVGSTLSREDKFVEGALTNLTSTVIGGIEDITRQLMAMPPLQSRILLFLIRLLIPVVHIAAGIILLLGVILNLVTNALKLPRLVGTLLVAKLSKLIGGLRPGQLLSKLGLGWRQVDIPGSQGVSDRLGLGLNANEGAASELSDMTRDVGQAVNDVTKDLGSTFDQTTKGVANSSGINVN